MKCGEPGHMEKTCKAPDPKYVAVNDDDIPKGIPDPSTPTKKRCFQIFVFMILFFITSMLQKIIYFVRVAGKKVMKQLLQQMVMQLMMMSLSIL
jgi:hypothetical protein